MKKVIAVSSALAGICSVSAFAEGMMIKKSSPLFVSPVQLNQVQTNAPELEFSFGQVTGKTEAQAGETEVKATNTQAGVSNVYQIPGTNLNIGLDVGYISRSTELKDADQETSVEGWRISPALSYTFADMFTAGLSIDQISTEVEAKGEQTTFDRDTQNRFTLGFGVANEMGEAGLVVTPKAELDENVEEPTMVSLHGRYFIGDQFAVGSIITQTMYSEIEVNDKKVNKDATSLKLTGEFAAADNVKVEALVGFQPAYYNGAENINVNNVQKIDFEVGGDIAVQENVTVGAKVAFETANGEESDVKYSSTDWTAGVRGSYLF